MSTSVEFFTGFDWYSNSDFTTIGEWTSGPGGSAGSGVRSDNPRTGPQHFRMFSISSFGVKTGLSHAVSRSVGFAGYPRSFTNNGFSYGTFLGVHDDVSYHIVLGQSTSGNLVIFRGGIPGDLTNAAPIATSTNTLSLNTYYYIVLVVTVDNTVGTAEVYVNGVKDGWIDYTGDTQNTANAYSSGFGFAGTTGITWDFDDMYTAAGSTPLLDCHVAALFPTGEGNTTQWDPSTGTDNSATVDDTTENGDTDYNSTAGTGNKDTLIIGNLSSGNSLIYSVASRIVAKSTSGSSTITPVVRNSSTDYDGTPVAIGTSYATASTLYATNPGTSAAWTETEINADEFGYKF